MNILHIIDGLKKLKIKKEEPVQIQIEKIIDEEQEEEIEKNKENKNFETIEF